MTSPVERVPLTDGHRLSDVTLDYWASAAETAPPGELGRVNFPTVAQMLIVELRASRAELSAEPGRAVTHLALIQASLPPGLTEVAGGTEQHCQAHLEHWVTERGLRDGERALIVAVLAETVVEPGVGIYTVPAVQP